MATKSEYDSDSHYENFEQHAIDCSTLEIGKELCVQFGISNSGHHFVAVFDGSDTVTRFESEEPILGKLVRHW